MGTKAAGRKFAALISVILSMLSPTASRSNDPTHTICAMTVSDSKGAMKLAPRLSNAS